MCSAAPAFLPQLRLRCLYAAVFLQLYNDGKVSVTDIAQISQYSENEYFGKPCGLMDQLACAHGGVVAINFKDSLLPEVEGIKYDFARRGYSIIITDVREDHADLTGEYAAITDEMAQVCAHFGVKRLCEVEQKVFLQRWTSCIKKCLTELFCGLYIFMRRTPG